MSALIRPWHDSAWINELIDDMGGMDRHSLDWAGSVRAQ